MLKSNKIEYEWITPDEGSSFRLIEVDMSSNRFFWHAHPEYEIVYIQKGEGRQQIGNHVSEYSAGEIVFIGPNIPHLGFGYNNNFQRDHREIVVQLKEDFLGVDFLKTPEFRHIKQLFESSKNVFSFKGEARKQLSSKLEKLPKLKSLDRLLALLKILQIMAETQEFDYLIKEGTNLDLRQRDSERANKIFRFVEENYKDEIRIETVADVINLTPPSFCRFFKGVMHMTFSDFLSEYRVSQAKSLLLEDYNISEVCFESGFNSLSHFDKTFKKITAKNPSDYRKDYKKKVTTQVH